MRIKIKKYLPRFKIAFNIDDFLIFTGTILAVYGLWGYDPRAALIILGIWLIFLGRGGND
jgi:hypothetical protein